MRRPGLTSALALAALLVAAAPAPALEGPTGRLTQVSSGPAVTHACITDDGSGGACTNGRALDSPSHAALVISPDGGQLYAGTDAGIAVLQRDYRTGALLQSSAVDGCFNFLGLADGSPCESIGGPANPMGAVTGIAISPEGANVYAAVGANDAVISLWRDPVTGLLLPLGDVIGGGLATTCAALSPGAPASTAGCGDARAIDDPGAVAVSPDGSFVYVSSHDSDAVAVFARGGGGKLTQLTSGAGGSDACISDDGGSEDGAATCRDGNDAVLSDGDAMPLAVSGDSADVYVGGDGGVLDLQRGASGELSESGCLYGGVPPPGCAAATAGLDDPTALAVSQDLATLYATSAANDSLSFVPRNGVGSLSAPGGCIGIATSACGDKSGRGLSDPEGVTLSPDGTNVYVAAGRLAGQSRSVSTFNRPPGGTVVTQEVGPAGCTAETPSNPPDTAGCADGKALSGAVSVVAAPDGNHVYTGALAPTDGAAAFTRTSPPETALRVAPPHVGTRRRARFVIFSNEPIGAVFCHLDKQPERFCDTDVPTPRLKYGLHRFEAHVVDLSGQPDPTPVIWYFAVKRKQGKCKDKKGKRKGRGRALGTTQAVGAKKRKRRCKGSKSGGEKGKDGKGKGGGGKK